MTPRSVLCVFPLGELRCSRLTDVYLGLWVPGSQVPLSLLVPAFSPFMLGGESCPDSVDLTWSLDSPRRTFSLPPTQAESRPPESSLTYSPALSTKGNFTFGFCSCCTICVIVLPTLEMGPICASQPILRYALLILNSFLLSLLR